MTKKKKIKGQALWTGVAVGAFALGGCSKIAEVAETSDASAVKISGAFSSVSGGLSREMNRSLARSLGGGIGGAASVALPAGLSVYCVTFSKPPTSGEGSIGSDGKFSVTVSGAKGKKMGCFVVDADGEKKATLVIKDSSQKSIDGEDKKSDSTAFNSNADLGNLALDLDKGEVEIPIEQIVAEGSAGSDSPIASDEAPADAVDFSGNYVIAALDFELPEGYLGPCSGAECHGPPLGQSLYLKRINATSVADGSPVYGIQLWEGTQSQVEASCGTRLGITDAEAASLGISLSSYSAGDRQAFAFSSSVNLDRGSGAASETVTSGWKLQNASLKWDLYPNCGPIEVTVGGVQYHAWKCSDSSGGDMQVNIGGGCVITGSSTPVRPTSWGSIGSCSSTVDANNIYHNSCSGTGVPVEGGGTQNVTCTNEYYYANSGGTIQADGSAFNQTEANAGVVNAGSLCSSVADALQQARCYADDYYQMRGQLQGQGCLPELRTNWTATNATDFAQVDKRPSSMIFMEKLDYSDASSASFRQERDDFRGVELNGGWVPCPVHQVGSGVFSKQDDGKILVIYSESEKTTSSDEACQAAFAGESREFMFYLQ